MTQMAELAVYRRLGVRPVINAQGNRTVLGGSTPGPEVKAAMDQADGSYVKMQDLLDRTGEFIADLLDVEAAYVTSGCATALALSAAACMTGDDPCKISQLPDTTGLKSEILIQKAHRYSYDRSFTVPGAKLVEGRDRRRLFSRAARRGHRSQHGGCRLPGQAGGRRLHRLSGAVG